MLDGAKVNAAIAGIDGISWRKGSATGLPFEGNGECDPHDQ